MSYAHQPNAYVKSEKIVFFACAGRMLPRKVILDKKDASNFFGVVGDNIDDECYEEGCTFNEVVNHYGHSETSVSLLFRVQDKLLCRSFRTRYSV